MIDQKLPPDIYTAAQCKALDRSAILNLGIPGYKLMQRAAQAALSLIHQEWPKIRSLSIWVGSGNNGGDGVALARFAHELGWRVQLVIPDQSVRVRAKGEAAQAWADLPASIAPERYSEALTPSGELIIDALLGIGVTGEVKDPIKSMIERINKLDKKVLSLDLPSGLDCDKGCSLGATVRADVTLTFITNKLGWLINQGPEFSGKRFWAGLGLPASIDTSIHPVAQMTHQGQLSRLLPRRSKLAHKGRFGVVLVIGGNLGMGGAAILAAEAALRSGAGRVILATRSEHVTASLARIPEVMVRGVDSQSEIEPLIAAADVVVIGPGLGRDDWARCLLDVSLRFKKPRIFDADALNLISEMSLHPEGEFIFTPHAAEAARLIGSTVSHVVADPLAAVKLLVEHYQGCQVLKGAGTLCCSLDGISVCDRGNPGMATAGMGDTLSGIISGLVAQGLSVFDAASLGVWVHAVAADKVAEEGEIGMIASDLLPRLRSVLN